MRRGLKYRLYPNEQQAVLIHKTVGCARLIYNAELDDYKKQLEQQEHKPKLKEITHFKQQYDFLKEVDSLALANAKVNLNNALQNFFKSRNGKRKGKRCGFPQFHTKNKTKWRYTTNNQGGSVRLDVENNKIKLPKLGWVFIELHRVVEGEIYSCSVEATRDGKYYVSLNVEVTEKVKQKNFDLNNLKVVGLDMSLSSFVVSSENDLDDTKTKYIKQYRKNERKLQRLQRQLSNKQKGSANSDKARERLAKHHGYVSNCRKDYCHKLSRYYASHYDVIVLEDLNMQDMSRSLHLGKSVHDLGFGLFRSMLSYKCAEEDSIVMYADKWYASSKLCNHCGEKNSLLQLSDREWACPHCGAVLDRDFNASCNLRDYYYTIINTAGTAGIKACGDVASTLRETLVQVMSAKQEVPSFKWG